MSKSRMRVRTVTTEDAETWSRVGDGEIFVSDIVDQAAAPDARMTVGFARLGEGEALDISFPYDEVLIVTRGSYTVRTEDGETVTARAGQVIYLPAGSSSSSRADEDTENGVCRQPAVRVRRPRGGVVGRCVRADHPARWRAIPETAPSRDAVGEC